MNTQEQLRDKVVGWLRTNIKNRNQLNSLENGKCFYNAYLRHHPEILDLAFGHTIDITAKNKKTLLGMKKKPSKRSRCSEERRLASALCRYISKTQTTYDPEFDKLIRKMKPEWFVDTADENKKILLELKVRPIRNLSDEEETRLARLLSSYTSRNSRCYDSDFHRLIKTKNPRWFFDNNLINKQKLLELTDRPSCHSKQIEERQLGQALCRYTNTENRYFDTKFNKLIRKNKPEWFIDTVIEKKRKLLQLENKPKYSAVDPEEKTLWIALQQYTTKSTNSYDAEFDKLIRGAKPKWFVDTTLEKKNKLLQLKDRPSQTSKDSKVSVLGRALSNYTNTTANSYDPDFDKLIRKTKPEWFK